jgi:[glutamine synthetase] adenylyltransferase / [glutamine synthetase]-adenylyl-L-tyrosine phosphorylase
VPAAGQDLVAELATCADPVMAESGLSRLLSTQPGAKERLDGSPALRTAVVTVMAASPFLTRTCVTDPAALDVLSELDRPVGPDVGSAGGGPGDGPGAGEGGAGPSRWKALEVLRIAALDLMGRAPLEQVGRSLADLAGALLRAAARECGPHGMAVIAMGKLGAQELNYGSDIDIVLVGEGDPRPFLARARQAWRTDLDLRPEGRAGPAIRSLASYRAYWDRWAQTWEFQALLKARPVAGDPGLGAAFAEEAAGRVWGRPLGADDLRSLRAMKARAEHEVARQGLSHREVKLGPGGIRDIEFAVQLLQLVHGRDDPALRARPTLAALQALADGGYVARTDAGELASAYRFLRAVEHRLQLFEDTQVHALPAGAAARDHLARVMGYRDGPSVSARGRFEEELSRHQSAARSIHERLFFRPLLEAFVARRPRGEAGRDGATAGAALSEAAISERLNAFGFSDAERARKAVLELTQGFSRSSRLMQAMVPLVLDWLSESPDPDLGLLGLRRVLTGPHRRAQLTALFRESPEAARRLCVLLGSSPLYAEGFEHHPEQLALLPSGPPPPPDRDELQRRAWEAMAWRPRRDWWRGLAGLQRAELLRAEARDVLGLTDLPGTASALTALAEAVLEVALGSLAAVRAGANPARMAERAGRHRAEGIAVIAMGRFGGADLAYGSDLDVLVVFDDERVTPAAAEAVAEELRRLVRGTTPVERLYDLDLSLRPEGRNGALARSLKAFATYYARWAQVWERQALTRGRFVAGDPEVGARFAEVAAGFVWGRPLTDDEAREIRRLKARVERERVPAGEDPEFHLKLGPGSLSDVEWTVQLLQLQAGVRAEGTLNALATLTAQGAIDPGDAAVLAESYRFCEATRNRLFLVRGRPGDALPAPGHQLTALARSLGTTAPDLRDQYRRLTRRARRVTERLFYGSPGNNR